MAAISTILLVANLLAWIINGIPLFSFWINLWAYLIEIGIYFVLFIVFAIIAGVLGK